MVVREILQVFYAVVDESHRFAGVEVLRIINDYMQRSFFKRLRCKRITIEVVSFDTNKETILGNLTSVRADSVGGVEYIEFLHGPKIKKPRQIAGASDILISNYRFFFCSYVVRN